MNVNERFFPFHVFDWRVCLLHKWSEKIFRLVCSFYVSHLEKYVYWFYQVYLIVTYNSIDILVQTTVWLHFDTLQLYLISLSSLWMYLFFHQIKHFKQKKKIFINRLNINFWLKLKLSKLWKFSRTHSINGRLRLINARKFSLKCPICAILPRLECHKLKVWDGVRVVRAYFHERKWTFTLFFP